MKPSRWLKPMMAAHKLGPPMMLTVPGASRVTGGPIDGVPVRPGRRTTGLRAEALRRYEETA
jgi:hypothetical protein